ncbi:MAG: hypothetical protein HC908_00555 [Calothrix sp. SM1_7_51]|nr:hypothetical protein [Calothrix sp. SM1_7_51]
MGNIGSEFSGTTFNSPGSVTSPGNVTVTGNITTIAGSPTFGSRVDTVIISAPGDITTGNINTSTTSSFNIDTGGVNLNAGGNLQTGAVNTSATVTGSTDITRAGNVRLNAVGNIIFNSIDTRASSTLSQNGNAGNILVSTQRGTVRGLETAASSTFTIDARSDESRGSVEILHGGGVDNVPFIVGDATINGTFSGIATKNQSLNSQSFAEPGRLTFGNIEEDRIIINFQNSAPTLPQIVAPLNTNQNQPISFILATLGLFPTDADDDNVAIQISTILPGAIFTSNGEILRPGDTITSRSNLEFTPPTGTTGTINNAFSLVASDRVSNSTPTNVGVEVASTNPPIEPPPIEPPPIEPPPVENPPIENPPIENPPDSEEKPVVKEEPQPESEQEPDFKEEEDNKTEDDLPKEIASSNQSSIEVDPFVSELEESITNQFEGYLDDEIEPDVKDLPDAREALNNVEKNTGIKPALVYAMFVPETVSDTDSKIPQKIIPKNSDVLEVFIVTSTGKPIRKRVASVTRELVLKSAQKLHREVSEQKRTVTNAYLTPAKQLYQWIVAPLETELQKQGIKKSRLLSPTLVCDRYLLLRFTMVKDS